MRKVISVIVLNILLMLSINGQSTVELIGSLNPRSGSGYMDIWGYDSDGREYALLTAGGGTSIIDITDPLKPVEVSFISGPNSNWRDLKVHEDYLYVVTEGGGDNRGLQIIDLSDLPNNATLVKTTDEFFSRAHNIFISDGFAFVIGTNDGGGMHILDLTDPVNPVETAYYLDSDYIHDVYVWGDTVIACAADTYDLIDVSDKTNPHKISSSPALPGIYAHSGWMTEDKRYFIAAEEFNERDIMVWDLQDRNNWELVVEELKISDTGPVHNIFVKGDYAHVSYYAEGYVVLDISNPTQPILVGEYDTTPLTSGFNGAWGCYPYLPSGNIIISDMVTGLYIFSFTPVDNPAPFLVPELLPNQIYAQESAELKLTVLDNSEIVEAFVYYRTTKDNSASDWIKITDADGPNGNEYQFLIPPQSHLSLVEYYFAVKDDGGSVVTAPEGGSGEPAGTIPPESYYSYTSILAGIPIISSITPIFTDTTITKGDKIEFFVEAEDTSSLDLNYSWFINGEKKGSRDQYTYRTNFISTSHTDTLSLEVSNGFNTVYYQWIITVDLTLTSEKDLNISYSLNQNYPNPFNPSTQISYSIPEAANVKLLIYNSIGELVGTLVDSYQSSGNYTINFSGEGLSSGLYVAQLITEKYSSNIKMLLVK